MRPSFEELSYFLEVSKSLNISKTSIKLGITQPTLSLAIKRLERTIGAPLFIRHKQGLSLTRSGIKLAERVEKLLVYWEETRLVTQANQQEIKGHYLLGCHAAMAYHFSRFLPDILQQYCELEISFMHDNSETILNGVLHSKVDLAVVSKPKRHPKLCIQKLYETKMAFWIAADKKKFAMLDEPTTIICDPSSTQTQLLLNASHFNADKNTRIITSTNLEFIVNMTLNGGVIGIIPCCIAQQFHPDRLTQMNDLPSIPYETCLVYRNENKEIPAIHLLENAIKTYVARY